MQFLIIAYDGKDAGAMDRRMAAREAHLQGVASLKQLQQIIAGGAILDDDNRMIGSTLYVEFESREELNTWLNNDPYVTGGVWKDISIQPIKLAVRN